MPTTFPKCSVQFFAATSAAGSLWRASEWLRGFEVDARAKQHARAPSRMCLYVHPRTRVYTRTLRSCVRACVRACVAYTRVLTYARLQPDRRRREEKGRREVRDLFARISMVAAVAAPLPKNASRIRDLSRNTSYGGFPRRGSPRVFDRCFSIAECLRDEVEDTSKYYISRFTFENFSEIAMHSGLRIVSAIFQR